MSSHISEYPKQLFLNGTIENLPVKTPGTYGTEDIWVILCSSVAIIFKSATFIVYSLVPKLNNNLQGWIVLSFLASDIGNMLLATVRYLQVVSDLGLSGNLRTAIDFMGYFCGLAHLLWLNVMSFDIWRKFRTIRSSMDMTVDVKKRQRTTYLYYSIPAWGVPIVASIIYLRWYVLPTKCELKQRLTLFYWFGVPGIVVFICNTCFYTMTALKIKQLKKETEHIVGGLNKHHQENQQWFNLHLKLFIMTGYPMFLWAISHFWNNDIFAMFVPLTEALQGLFVFLMFVWKDDVKSSICKLFSEMLRNLGSCFYHNSTPVIENGNEKC